LLFVFSCSTFAQKPITSDSIVKEKAVNIKPTHSPHKATVFSMVLPGLGQAYNHKYWKIPVIYAGFGVLGYYLLTNNDEYSKFKEAYRYVASGDTSPISNPYVGKYNQDQLLTAKDYYRRRLELTYILSGVWYLLNVVDATVDAHFFDYDISDDLSMHIEPAIQCKPLSFQPQPGVRLTFRF